MKSGLTVKQRQRLEKAVQAINTLAKVEVLVGVPADHSKRDENPDEPPELTNAYLAFIHDQGAPEQNIPQREFMVPGMEAAIPAVTRQLEGAARAAANGNMLGVEQRLHNAGLAASSSIKRLFDAGIAPPLAESTLRRRAAKGSKGAALELAARKEGRAASTTHIKPLIDSGQLRNSITHTIRAKERN